MFEEQVGWAVAAGVDFVMAETLRCLGEAELALRAISATGLPAVVTLVVDWDAKTREGTPLTEAAKRLADAGADVVGLNCAWGPATMLPLLAPLVSAVDVPVAALPVPYRTTPRQPTFQSLSDAQLPDEQAFPTALDPFTCNRYEIAQFTSDAAAVGVAYFGLCCGAAPHHVRAMAEALGRTPPASRYSADMSKHVYLGDDPRLARHNLAYRRQH
jgi:betaine-homocysteine S-methyltransferase